MVVPTQKAVIQMTRQSKRSFPEGLSNQRLLGPASAVVMGFTISRTAVARRHGACPGSMERPRRRGEPCITVFAGALRALLTGPTPLLQPQRTIKSKRRSRCDVP